MPLLANNAKEIGLVDKVFAEDWNFYHQALQLECEELASDKFFIPLLKQKKQRRTTDEAIQPLETYRSNELRAMKATFDNAQSDYHSLRYNFVYKVSCGRTPTRLMYKAHEERLMQTA